MTKLKPSDFPEPLFGESLVKSLIPTIKLSAEVADTSAKWAQLVIYSLPTEQALEKGVYIPLKTAQPVEDSDGVLTGFGIQVAERYATAWVRRGARDLELERHFPELEGFFADIRSDSELAQGHAGEK